jgi:hypothetical protein
MVKTKLSALVRNQFPAFYQEEGENFLAFIEAYYEYLEQNGKLTDAIQNLQPSRDINTTLDEYITYFQNTLLPSVPHSVVADKRLLAKYVKYYNVTRGSLSSYKLLFRTLYNEPVEVYYPADQMLKVSDGDWNLDRYLVTSYDINNYKFIGRTIQGQESRAEALVEDVVGRVIRNRDVMQLIVSNVKGSFNHLEPVKILGEVSGGSGHAPIVEAGISRLQIISPGGEYTKGDVVKLLSNKVGDFGKVVVTDTIDLGGSITFSITDGGSGYTSGIGGEDQGETLIFVQGGDGQSPASFTLEQTDIGDTFAISINTNLIGSNNIYGSSGAFVTYADSSVGIMNTFANTIIGASTFGFPEYNEVVGNKDYRDNTNAAIQIANSAQISLGDSLYGATSSANAIVTDLVDATAGNSWYRVDTYRNFLPTETIKIGSPSGASVGTVTSFQSNTVGGHVLQLGRPTSVVINEGDELVSVGRFVSFAFANTADALKTNEAIHSFAVVKKVVADIPYAYEHNPTANTILSGTVSSSANTVTGVGTTFLSDFVIGDVIKAGAQSSRRVVSVADNFNLVVSDPFNPALSSEAYGKGGEWRDLTTYRVTANNTANTSNQFDTGPMIPFIELDGVRKVGSSTVIANVAYTSSNTVYENRHTLLSDSLLFKTATFGTIENLSNKVGGDGYSVAPTVRVIEPNIASLGIGEQYITLESDDIRWGTANSQVSGVDTNDGLFQVSTGASGDIKAGAGPNLIPQTVVLANGTYQTTVRVWQPFLQRFPGNIFFANNTAVTIRKYESSVIPGEVDARTTSSIGTAKIVKIIDEGIVGNNAKITPSVGANGTITALRVIDSGYSYSQFESVRIEESDHPDATQAVVRLTLNNVANSEGYYSSSRSHVSSKRGYIQDSNFYQEFAYQVIAPLALNRYKEIALKLVHPAGQRLFGKYQSHSNVSVNVVSTSNNSTRAIGSGTVSLSNTSFNVVGSGTTFLSDYANNETIIVEVSPKRFYKIPLNIVSSDTLANTKIQWAATGIAAANIYYTTGSFS